MIRFTFSLLLLLSTLLFGVLLGIQQAEHGIFSVWGSEPKGQVEVKDYYIKKIDGQKVEKQVMNESFSTERLAEKAEKWKQAQERGRLSQWGESVGNVVYNGARKLIVWFISVLDQWV